MVRKLIESSLKEVSTQIDVRDGTAISDFFIKPMQFLLEPLALEIARIRIQQSLRNWDIMDDDELDAHVANLFVTRKEGNYTQGTVRIYFDSPRDVNITQTLSFVSQNGDTYYPIAFSSFTSDQIAEKQIDGKYYIDINAIAAEPGDKTVGVGEIIDIPGNPIQASGVTNVVEFIKGVPRETNEDLYNRTQKSLGVRDLVRGDSIETVLFEEFNLLRIQPIGFGDPEMDRDYYFMGLDAGGSSIYAHLGGMTDIYIKEPEINETLTQVNLASSSVLPDKVILSPTEFELRMSPYFASPVLRIESIIVCDPGAGVDEPCSGIEIPSSEYYIRVGNTSTRFSIREDNWLHMNNIDMTTLGGVGDLVNKTIRVTYKNIVEINAIQDYVEDPVNRIVCADLLVKSFEPVFIGGTIQVYLADDTTNNAETLTTIINNAVYLNDVEQISDIVDILYSNGVRHVVLPATLDIERHESNGNVFTGTTQDSFSVSASAEEERVRNVIPRNLVVEVVS
jgi:hypothetical protein